MTVLLDARTAAQPIAFNAPAAVHAAIAALGRTEDIAFSPDNRRLAIAAFSRSVCLVIDLRLDFTPRARAIDLIGAVEFTSPSLNQPHGLAFLDDRTLIVANRGGLVTVLELPPPGSRAATVEAPTIRTLHGALLRRLNSPGSIVVRDLGGGLREVLICNNYIHRVTRHVLDARARFRVKSNRTLIHRGLDTPDGIDVSRDGRWIAVSNHMTQNVLLYENRPGLDRETEPAGSLPGIHYAHGVRFTHDGRTVLVADAGSPQIHAFGREGGDWRGTGHRRTSFTVMSRETFRRGHANAQEGGPKGIAIDGGMNVLAATSEHQPLAFFDLAWMLAACNSS